MIFSPEDISQIEQRGLALEQVKEQISIFKKQIRHADLKAAATIDNGIKAFNSVEEDAFLLRYDTEKKEKEVVKFTPASGAATRMFKFLYAFLAEYRPEKESINSYINKNKASDLKVFFVGLEKFPFYKLIKDHLEKDSLKTGNTLSNDQFRLQFVKMMLQDENFDLGSIPKGLFPFHNYEKGTATPFEEHLSEANRYACVNGKAKLHFTISPQHQALFEKKEKEIIQDLSNDNNCEFEISYSFQQGRTDTIAVDSKNEPLRDKKGRLVFRPGGHGSLIENL